MAAYFFIILCFRLVYIYGLNHNNQQPLISGASDLTSKAQLLPIPQIQSIPSTSLLEAFPKPAQDHDSLARLDRPTMGLKMYPPSDLGLSHNEAWDHPSSTVVVALDGPLNERTKAKLRVASLKRRGFSVKEGSLTEVHNLKIQRDYNPEAVMVNYPGGFHSVPLRDADGKPLPEEHIKAMMERVTPLDHSKVAGPYPGRYSTTHFPGQTSSISPYYQGSLQMAGATSHTSGVYLPNKGRYRTYRDRNTKGGPTLVVWEPTVVKKDLSDPPVDIIKGSEHFRLLKEGGHQLWINAKQQSVAVVQQRAMDLASRGYRVYIYPEIPWSLEAIVPGHATRFPFDQPMPEGASVSSKGGNIMPLVFISFVNGEFVSKAPLWQGGTMLPPILAECLKDVMFYKPSKIILLDAASRYWILTGPNTAQVLPGYKPEHSMPYRQVVPHFSTGSAKGRGMYYDKQAKGTVNQWGRNAVAGPSRQLPAGRYGSIVMGKRMPVAIDGIFRDTNECHALSKYGANPTEFGLIPTLGGSILYKIANKMTHAIRELAPEIFIYRSDICLALRILIVMYDEMRNSLQCVAVLAAVINVSQVLKAYQNQSERFLNLCRNFHFPDLPPITERPIDLAFLSPKEIYKHFHLDMWPEISSYSMRLDRAGSMRASAMQQAISQSGLEFTDGNNVPSYDVVAAIIWMLDEKFLDLPVGQEDCGLLVKHIFTKHSNSWAQVDANILNDICKKSGFTHSVSGTTMTALDWDDYFPYSTEGSQWREYLPVDDVEVLSDFVVHSIFCKTIDVAGNCSATSYASSCNGLSAYLVNRAQLMAYYAEKILLKNKAVKFNVNINHMCAALMDSLSETDIVAKITQLGQDFPMFRGGNNAAAFWSSFVEKENKAMRVAQAATLVSFYKTPKKFMSSTDASLLQLNQEEELTENAEESSYDD